jgi:hypothetical protein
VEPRFTVDSVSGGTFRVTTRGGAPREGAVVAVRGTAEFVLTGCIGIYADGTRSWTATIRKMRRAT